MLGDLACHAHAHAVRRALLRRLRRRRPTQLQRTVADAITHEAGVRPGRAERDRPARPPRVPVRPSANRACSTAAGMPAVLVQVSGERGPGARALGERRTHGRPRSGGAQRDRCARQRARRRIRAADRAARARPPDRPRVGAAPADRHPAAAGRGRAARRAGARPPAPAAVRALDAVDADLCAAVPGLRAVRDPARRPRRRSRPRHRFRRRPARCRSTAPPPRPCCRARPCSRSPGWPWPALVRRLGLAAAPDARDPRGRRRRDRDAARAAGARVRRVGGQPLRGPADRARPAPAAADRLARAPPAPDRGPGAARPSRWSRSRCSSPSTPTSSASAPAARCGRRCCCSPAGTSACSRRALWSVAFGCAVAIALVALHTARRSARTRCRKSTRRSRSAVPSPTPARGRSAVPSPLCDDSPVRMRDRRDGAAWGAFPYGSAGVTSGARSPRSATSSPCSSAQRHARRPRAVSASGRGDRADPGDLCAARFVQDALHVRARAGRHGEAQLVVFARPSPPCSQLGNALAERQSRQLDLAGTRRCPPRCRASVASPSERSIIACTPGRASARPSPRRGNGRLGPRRRALPVTPTRSPTRARRARRARAVSIGPADDRHGHGQHRRATTSPPAIVVLGARRQLRAPRTSSSARLSRRPRGETPSAMYASPARAPIAARSDSAPASARWPTSAGRRPAVVQAKVHALDHRVHRGHAQRAAGAHHGRVVADARARLAAPGAPSSQLGRDRFDQGALLSRVGAGRG